MPALHTERRAHTGRVRMDIPPGPDEKPRVGATEPSKLAQFQESNRLLRELRDKYGLTEIKSVG